VSALKAALPPVMTAVLIAGAALDLWSLFAWIRRNRAGGGPSGVAGASWFCYLAFCVWRQSFQTLIGLTLFHVCCQFILPALHRRSIAPPE
jgi:hypothetical protein